MIHKKVRFQTLTMIVNYFTQSRYTNSPFFCQPIECHPTRVNLKTQDFIKTIPTPCWVFRILFNYQTPQTFNAGFFKISTHYGIPVRVLATIVAPWRERCSCA